MRARVLLLALPLVIAGGVCAWIASRPAAPGPNAVGDFTLPDHLGATQHLYSYSKAKAVVIVGHGTSCPILQKYVIPLNELKAKYGPLGVIFLMINPNEEDTRESISKEAKEYGLELPVLLDASQIVTRRLGLTRTSETVVLNPKTWEPVFHGAINDRLSYGADKINARHNFLADALDDILAGRRIQRQPDAAKGCAYSFYRQDGLTYEKDIAPVLQAKCVTCHSNAGGQKPFLDGGYESVRALAPAIKKTMFMDSMTKRLLPKEEHDLVAWIDSGCGRIDGTAGRTAAQ